MEAELSASEFQEQRCAPLGLEGVVCGSSQAQEAFSGPRPSTRLRRSPRYSSTLSGGVAALAGRQSGAAASRMPQAKRLARPRSYDESGQVWTARTSEERRLQSLRSERAELSPLAQSAAMSSKPAPTSHGRIAMRGAEGERQDAFFRQEGTWEAKSGSSQVSICFAPGA